MTTDRSAAVLAHGLGGSTDLPIPFTYALIGAAWALAFTFAVVALAWRRPRFDPDKPGRPLPAWVTALIDASATRWAVAIAALLFAVWVAMAAFAGPQDARNPLPGVFYVLLWVGLMALSLAVGPVWRAISPVRTVYRLLGLGSLGLRRNHDGRIAIGNPFDHLPSLPVRPGTVAVLAVCLDRRRSTASRRPRSGATSSTTTPVPPPRRRC